MSNREAASVLDELLKSPVEDRPPTTALSSAVLQTQAAMLPQAITNVTAGLTPSQQQQAVLNSVNGTPLIKTEGLNSLAAPLVGTVAQRFPIVTRVVPRQSAPVHVATVPRSVATGVPATVNVSTVPRTVAIGVTRPVAIAPRPVHQNNATLAVSTGGAATQLQPVAVSSSSQMVGVVQPGVVAGMVTADFPERMKDATKRFLNALVDVAKNQTQEYGKTVSDLVRQLLVGCCVVADCVMSGVMLGCYRVAG